MSPGPAPSVAPAAAPSTAPAPAPHMAPVPASSMAPAPAPVHAPAPGQETRLRVSVKLSVRDPNLVIARPLAAGEPAPPGTREAMLILIEPAADGSNPSDGGHTP